MKNYRDFGVGSEFYKQMERVKEESDENGARLECTVSFITDSGLTDKAFSTNLPFLRNAKIFKACNNIPMTIGGNYTTAKETGMILNGEPEDVKATVRQNPNEESIVNGIYKYNNKTQQYYIILYKTDEENIENNVSTKYYILEDSLNFDTKRHRSAFLPCEVKLSDIPYDNVDDLIREDNSYNVRPATPQESDDIDRVINELPKKDYFAYVPEYRTIMMKNVINLNIKTGERKGDNIILESEDDELFRKSLIL